MEKFFIFIVFGVVVVINIVRKMAEYNRSRPGNEDGWDNWDGNDASPQPTPARSPTRVSPAPAGPVRTTAAGTPRQPSDRVRKILQQLQQMESGQAPTQRTVAAAPPPPPEPVVVPAKPLIAARPEPPPPAPSAPPRAESTFAPVGEPAVSMAFAEADLPDMSNLLNPHGMGIGLEETFPDVPGRGSRRKARLGHRRPIAIRARGRANMRRGIIMAEIFGQPRAFDI